MTGAAPDQLTLAAASVIADAAVAKARALDLKPIVVAVVDRGGHLLVLKREEEAGPLYVDMAAAKAWTGVSIGRPPRRTGESLAARGLLGTLTGISGGRFLPLAGSVLILGADGRILGGVGVAGPSSGENDEICALAGIAAAGLDAAGNGEGGPPA